MMRGWSWNVLLGCVNRIGSVNRVSSSSILTVSFLCLNASVGSTSIVHQEHVNSAYQHDVSVCQSSISPERVYMSSPVLQSSEVPLEGGIGAFDAVHAQVFGLHEYIADHGQSGLCGSANLWKRGWVEWKRGRVGGVRG